MSQELSDLKTLVDYMKRQEEVMKIAEERFQAAKDRFEFFRDDVIPLLMRDIGVEEFTLETGEKVSIETKYYGNISEARRETAMKWLRANNEGALIKTSIAATFGAGELEKVELAMFKQFLASNEIDHDEKTAVHPQTLKSFIRRKMEAGEQFPYVLFSVFVSRQAHVE